MIDLQMDFVRIFTGSYYWPIWNEIVVDLPRQLPDIVQGVFYLVDDDNEEASKRKPNEKGMKSFWTFAHTGSASSFVWDPTLGVEIAESETQAMIILTMEI